MKVIYDGPFADGVTIAATGQHAPKGTPVEVDDDLGARLLEQDVWKPDDEPAKKAKARAATAPEAEKETDQ